jgi:L-aminopeptidase/D-esterase-like protein
MSNLRTGPLNSITDVYGLRVGNAIDSYVKTGVTGINRRRTIFRVLRRNGWGARNAGYRFTGAR